VTYGHYDVRRMVTFLTKQHSTATTRPVEGSGWVGLGGWSYTMISVTYLIIQKTRFQMTKVIHKEHLTTA